MDEREAQKLVDGLEWLSLKGREGAQILDRIMTDKGPLEEAVAWLKDLRDGVKP